MSDDGRQPPGPQGVAGRVERICRSSLQAAGVDGGGGALVGDRGHRATICATDDIAAAIEEASSRWVKAPAWTPRPPGRPCSSTT
jgi:hypothetical protein